MVFYRRFLEAAVILLVLTSLGCAKQHYFVIQADSIVLYYQNPEANQVQFASSIDRFKLHPASNVEDGLWQVTVPKRDRFTYFYLVDEVPGIPECALTVTDDFGARNCIFSLDM